MTENIIDWDEISRTPNLPEEFIRENKDNVYWPNISFYQELSEEFLREFQDKIYWKYISYKQILSQEFIIDYFDRLDLDLLLENKQITLSDDVKLLIKIKKL